MFDDDTVHSFIEIHQLFSSYRLNTAGDGQMDRQTDTKLNFWGEIDHVALY